MAVATATAIVIVKTTQLLIYLFKWKFKDGCLSKLTINKSRHGATQFKKIVDAFASLCEDKNYKYIDEIISMNTKLTEAYTPNTQEVRQPLFEFDFTIKISVIWIYKTVADSKNWMRNKSLWESLLILDWLP